MCILFLGWGKVFICYSAYFEIQSLVLIGFFLPKYQFLVNKSLEDLTNMIVFQFVHLQMGYY